MKKIHSDNLSVNVKVYGQIISVPTGIAEEAIDEIISEKYDINEIRKKLEREKIRRKPINLDFGYVNFDELKKDELPTIVGDFYKEETRFGRKLTGMK